jgi:hypothetical protein
MEVVAAGEGVEVRVQFVRGRRRGNSDDIAGYRRLRAAGDR